MKPILFILLLAGFVPAFGQDKPEAKALPAMSTELKLAIRDVQVDMADLEHQDNQITTYRDQLKQKYLADQKTKDELIQKAYKEAKLSDKDFDIDAKLNFVPKPKEVKSVTPTENKGDKK